MRNKWSKIRRPQDADELVQRFQMVELVEQSAEEHVEEVESHDCTDLQRQAYDQGRQDGLEEGYAQCRAQVEEEMKNAVRLAGQIGRARVAALEEHEQDIVEVALAITRKLLLREIQIDKDLIVRQVRQVLELLSDQELVTLKVHPQDFTTLAPLQDLLREDYPDVVHLVLEADEDVEPGGCLVEQAGLLFDARLTQQLATVGSEFGLEVLQP